MKAANFLLPAFIATLSTLFTSAMAQGPYGTHFRHVVSAENTEGIDSYLDHPEINGHPIKIIIVTPNFEPNGVACSYNYSLYYNTTTARWAIRNVNGQNSFPEGCTFNVLIPSAGGTGISVYALPGSSSWGFDLPVTNGNPHLQLFITPIDPGYIVGNGNRQYVVMYALSPFFMWGISTSASQFQGGDPFNIFVTSPSAQSFTHRVTEQNSSLSVIDHPLLNGRPEVNFIFQRQFQFDNGASTTYNDRKKSSVYIDNKWHLQIDDGNSFHLNEDYNILILNNSEGFSCALPQAIDCGEVVSGSTIGLYNDDFFAGSEVCDENWDPLSSGGQKWYKYSAVDNTIVSVSFCGNPDFNPTIHAYTGVCENFACDEVAVTSCEDESGFTYSFEAMAGTTYQLRLGGVEAEEGTYEFTLDCQEPLNINNLNRDDEMLLYPNPAHDVINISSAALTDGQASYEVHDISGKAVASGIISGSSANKVDVSHLPSGSYFIKVASANFISTRKFVVWR